MTEPRPSIRPGEWFPADPAPRSAGLGGILVKMLVAACVGAILFALDLSTLAWVVWGIGGAAGAVSIGSARARRAMDDLLARLGGLAGRGMGWAVLVPTYLIGFTTVRLFRRLGGGDPLHLRDADRPSYWLPADGDRRKVRFVGALFATERPPPGHRGGRWLTALVALLGLLVAAEVGLRIFGYGDPIRYRFDSKAGYYLAPSQHTRRLGAEVRINALGMRSPEIARRKPAGTFRVLLLGDSTLYGGAYVDQEDIYSRRLERRLREAAPDRPIEVLNAGVNGWGPFHELGFVERFGTFGADIAVICLPFGDLRRFHSTLLAMPFLPAESTPTLAIEAVLHHLAWRYRSSVFRPELLRGRDERYQEGAAAYRELARRLKGAGAEVFVEVLPSRAAGAGQVPEVESEAVDLLRRTLAPEHVDVGFPAELFRGEDLAAHYHDGVHLDTPGHARYASYLADRLLGSSGRLADSIGAGAP